MGGRGTSHEIESKNLSTFPLSMDLTFPNNHSRKSCLALNNDVEFEIKPSDEQSSQQRRRL